MKTSQDETKGDIKERERERGGASNGMCRKKSYMAFDTSVLTQD